MAGCYWFLEENQTDEIRQAVALFEKRCGGDPWIIWHWVKFKGDIEALSAYAKSQLEHLISECKRKYGTYPQVQIEQTKWCKTIKEKIKEATVAFGCIAIALLLILACIVGIITIVGWVKTIIEWIK